MCMYVRPRYLGPAQLTSTHTLPPPQTPPQPQSCNGDANRCFLVVPKNFCRLQHTQRDRWDGGRGNNIFVACPWNSRSEGTKHAPRLPRQWWSGQGGVGGVGITVPQKKIPTQVAAVTGISQWQWKGVSGPPIPQGARILSEGI